jgi:hypothetical protein
MGACRNRSPRIAGLTIDRSVLTDGAYSREVPPPSLGIYADLYPGKRRLFGDQTRMFAELVRYGEESGVEVAVLSPGYRRTELGWRYDAATGLWKRERVPLPDVVLRRSGRFCGASPEFAAEDLDYFKAQDVLCTLPRSCSNKWAFYRMMSKSPRLRPHMPTTNPLRTSSVFSANTETSTSSPSTECAVSPSIGCTCATTHSWSRGRSAVIRPTSAPRRRRAGRRRW